MTIFEGSAVALVLPMFDNGDIDFEGFKRQVQRMIDGGVQALLVNGTTGETATITIEDEFKLLDLTLELAKGTGVKVICGAGSNDTQTALKKARYAKEKGADAILVVTPYYNKTSQRGLIQHYTTIADAVDIPMILYNVPGRTGTNIQPATAVKIAKSVDNIVAIKEASGDIGQVATLAALADGCLDIYSGNDDQIVPVLSLGGKGVISVLSNVAPDAAHDICEKYFEGDVKGSAELQLKALPLIDQLFCEVNPIPVKKAMQLMGIDCGPLRMPLTEISPEHEKNLAQAMKDFGIQLV